MNKYIVIFVFFVVSALLQHVFHELSHAFVGKMQGLKVTKIQWFTYHGGTKVFFENEDKVVNKELPITKQWIITNLAGISSTTLLAYFFTAVCCFLPMNYLRLFVWVLSIIFLLTDSSYALLCAFCGSGDLYLVNEYLGKNRFITKIIAGIVFAVNCFLTYLLVTH